MSHTGAFLPSATAAISEMRLASGQVALFKHPQTGDVVGVLAECFIVQPQLHRLLKEPALRAMKLLGAVADFQRSSKVISR